MEDIDPSLVWNCIGPAWSIDVHKCCDTPEAEYTVYLTGRHSALWRTRYIDGESFSHFVEGVQRLWQEWPNLLKDCQKYFAELPTLPAANLKGKVCFESCQVRLLAHKQGKDVVPTLAVHDADESPAVVYAVGRDIERLIDDLSQALAAMEIETVS